MVNYYIIVLINMGMGLLNEGNALRWRMQSFALADAKLCVGRCKALRGQMQSFAWTIAKLCVRVGLNWHRKVCPILDKIKGGKTHPTGHLAPRKFLLNLDNSRTNNAFALSLIDNVSLHPGCRYALPWAMCFCAYSACWSMRVR